MANAYAVAERLIKIDGFDSARELVSLVMEKRETPDNGDVHAMRRARARYYHAMDVMNVVVQLRNEAIYADQS